MRYAMIERTYAEWMERIGVNEDPRYLMIVRDTRNDIWYAIGKNQFDVITKMNIYIDEGEDGGYRPEYIYDITVPEPDNKLWMALIVEDNKRAITEDNNGLVAFGFEGIPTPAKGYRLEACTRNLKRYSLEFRNEEFSMDDYIEYLSE